MQALVLPVGSDLFAVPTQYVREVVASPRPTPLPTGPATLLGVFNLRGEIVPFFDTAALLELGHIARLDYGAVVKTALGPAGLVTTAIPQVTILGDRIGSTELAASAGSYALGTSIVVLLDVEALFNPVRVAGSSASPLLTVR